MINASKEFKEKLKKGTKIENYADITLSDGNILHLNPGDFWPGGCSIDDKTTDGKFGVGYCIGKTLSIRLANHEEQFSDYDFYGSIITLYVGMLMDNGTVEKIRKGVFYTTVPDTPGDIIEISAVDGMYRLDRDYAESNLSYPATLQQIITGVCLDCGIPIGFTQFDNMSFVAATKPENAKYRQVLSYACQIAGYNAHIDPDGYMQLVWYNTSLLDMVRYDGGNFRVWPHDTTLDGGDFDFTTPTMVIDGGNFTDPAPENVYQIKSLSVVTDDIVITGVQVVGEEEDNTATAGETGYMIRVENNPFANGQEQAVAAYLGARMIGLVFRPFSAEVLNNPLYEPFEVARVYDRKGNMYLTIINSVSYTIGSYTQIACEAEDPVRNGSSFYSSSAAAVVEARRNTKKQITEYDKAVQNMNQIASNAMGFFTTFEGHPDGSRITYLHDKPTLEESTTIYKQSIDGFFVSRDGGQSYTAGFDSNGNAVFNILYAVGIVCDWIRGGTLTLGGSGNVNGILRILNAAGIEIGRWDKDGIKATNGTFSGVLNGATGSFTGAITSSSATITGGTIKLNSGAGWASVIELSEGNKTSIFTGATIQIKEGSIGTLLYPGYVDTDTVGAKKVIVNGYFQADSGKVFGDFEVTGLKARVIDTPDYGEVTQYAYEMASPMFGDIGEGETDETGECYVYLDDIFSETVNPSIEYQVFLQKEGIGDVWVEDKQPGYFVVKGTENLKFAWEIKAKQRDYEFERLEKSKEIEPDEIDYEAEYMAEIDSLIAEQEEILYGAT